MKELIAMTIPGVPVFQEVLSVVSYLFEVVEFVHLVGVSLLFIVMKE